MRVGQLFGIDFRINLFFVALVGLFFVAGVLERGLIIFGLVMFHELAHTIAARLYGIRVIDVEILPFGGVARVGGEMSIAPSKEIAIALAGPMSNLLLIGIALGLKNYGIWSEELGPFFIQTNLLLAIFNLLPGLPLDGGRIVRSLLSLHVGISQATYIAARMGQFIAIMVIGFGIVGVLYGMNGLDVVIIALFVLYSATREKSLAPYLFIRHLAQKKDELSQGGVLPAELLVARADITIKELVKLFVPQKYHLVTILDAQMNYVGQINEFQLVDALFTYGLEYRLEDLIKTKDE